MKCHHCDYEKLVIHECPQCAGTMMSFSGSGTEKVQNEIESLLSQRGLSRVQVLRMDRDTTSGKGAHAQILAQFRQGRAQVLIGTQMVTKGLDFPNVTLVGVISADTALNVPDFRAAERTFQLLVASRRTRRTRRTAGPRFSANAVSGSLRDYDGAESRLRQLCRTGIGACAANCPIRRGRMW